MILHDRRTYGFSTGYSVVTKAQDQQKIIENILGFGQSLAPGGEYNQDRHNAIQHVSVQNDLETVVESIEKREGKSRLLLEHQLVALI